MCPLQQEFLVVKSVHQKQKRRLTKNVNFNENYLPSLPDNGAKIWLSLEPAHKIQNFRIKNEKCKLLNSIAIASAMRVVIHKEGLAMEAFLVSFLLRNKGWLKFFF